LKRISAEGGTDEQATAIYDALHTLLKNEKKEKAAAASAARAANTPDTTTASGAGRGGTCGGDGSIPGGLLGGNEGCGESGGGGEGGGGEGGGGGGEGGGGGGRGRNVGDDGSTEGGDGVGGGRGGGVGGGGVGLPRDRVHLSATTKIEQAPVKTSAPRARFVRPKAVKKQSAEVEILVCGPPPTAEAMERAREEAARHNCALAERLRLKKEREAEEQRGMHESQVLDGRKKSEEERGAGEEDERNENTGGGAYVAENTGWGAYVAEGAVLCQQESLPRQSEASRPTTEAGSRQNTSETISRQTGSVSRLNESDAIVARAKVLLRGLCEQVSQLYMYIGICTCKYAYVYLFIYIYIFICMSIYTYTYTYIVE